MLEGQQEAEDKNACPRRAGLLVRVGRQFRAESRAHAKALRWEHGCAGCVRRVGEEVKEVRGSGRVDPKVTDMALAFTPGQTRAIKECA